METESHETERAQAPLVGHVRDPRARARVTLALLTVAALLYAVDAGLALAAVPAEAAVARTGQRALVLLTVWAVEVLAGISFITWLVRVTHNLPGLGVRHTRYGTTWAIAGWFVPIMALFRPAQVTGDALVASHTRWQSGTHAWREASWPIPFRLWWAGFLFAGLVGRASLGLVAAALEDPALVPFASAIGVAVDAVAIVALALACWVVATTTARQHERAARLGAVGIAGAPSGRWPTVLTAGALVVAVAVVAVPDLVPTAGIVERTDAGAVVAGGRVAWEELQTGDCFVLPPGQEVVRVEVVPCGEPHDLTVIGIAEISAGPDEAYPGDDALVVRGLAVCEEALESAVAGGRADGPEDLLVVPPAPETWPHGDRRVVCVVESTPRA